MKQRILTGLPAAAVFLAVLAFGDVWFALLILGLSVIAYHEFLTINKIRRTGPIGLLGFIGILLILLQAFPGMSWLDYPAGSVLWLLLAGMLFVTVATRNRVTVDQAALGLLGVVYIGIGFHSMIAARLESGLALTLIVFIGVWLTDIAAYFAGRFFGRTPLWPSISPKKTVEGAVGGVLVTMMFAVGWALVRPQDLDLLQALVLGLAIAVAGQVGDMMESALKRARDVKDSGTILPGHGGVLDRVDSWLIVFPLVQVLHLIPS